MDNRRILVIDDDLEIWEAYRAVLAQEQEDRDSSRQRIAELLDTNHTDQEDSFLPDFSMHFAAQGQDGFNMVQRSLAESMEFAVAFIDIRMPPGWDGMETALRIRRIDPNIEIVIVTAYSDRSREEIAKTVGTPEKLLFLRKPFDPEELTQMALSLTEKWNLAQAEKNQRNELQAILSTSPAAIFTVNPQGDIASWNPAAEEITGYTAAEVIGKPCVMSTITVKNQCNECPVKAGSDPSLCDKNRELTILDRSGRQRIIAKSISCVYDNNDERIIKLVESFWDITARKEAEQALQGSETRFRSLVETTTDWVWEVDADGRFTYCSPVCETIYVYRPEELLGKHFYDALLPPDEATIFKHFFTQCVQEKSSFKNVERRSRRKDGKTIHIESSGSPVIGTNGVLLGYRGIDRDITERKKNEEERLHLEEQYRQSQKMEVLGTLAGGIAHDFNNVLTPIMSNIQISLLKLEQDSPLYDDLLDIKKSAEKAAALIRQILAFSRKQASMPRPLNLNDLILDFNKMLSRLIREDIELQLDLADDLWVINVDTSQMEQILINLVVNARDAITENGQIVITTQNKTFSDNASCDFDQQPLSGSYVMMSVKDNGSGMQQDTLSRIFDPFYTTKEVGSGTGLGLSLVHGIIIQHEGRIQIDTEAGKGTDFKIYFKKTEKNAEKEQEESHQVPGGNETILLVEDNFEVRIVITSSLEHFGYRVLEADCGKEAIRVFNEINGEIDLLLTDVVMPGMGGKAVAETMRAKKPNLPVIFMSGHPFDLASMELFGSGERLSFIQKPFYPQNIAQKVREALDSAAPKQR